MLNLGTLYAIISAKTDGLKRAEREANASFSRISSAAVKMAGIVGASFGAKEILSAADSYQTLQRRLQSVTKYTGDYVQVSANLYRTAQQNGAALEDIVALFQRMASASKEIGANNRQVEAVVRTVSQLGTMSGASRGAMAAGLTQFSQAMSSGVVRAEEFNSILENIPEVANRIAEGLGVSTGQLRKMVIDGKLASSQVFGTLLNQSEAINKEFGSFGLSLQQNLTRLANEVGRTFGELDKQIGVIEGINTGLQKTINVLLQVGIAWKSMEYAAISAVGFMQTAGARITAAPVQAITKIQSKFLGLMDKIPGVSTKGLQGFIRGVGEQAGAMPDALAETYRNKKQTLAKEILDLNRIIKDGFKESGESGPVDTTLSPVKSAITDAKAAAAAAKQMSREAIAGAQALTSEIMNQADVQQRLNGLMVQAGKLSQFDALSREYELRRKVLEQQAEQARVEAQAAGTLGENDARIMALQEEKNIRVQIAALDNEIALQNTIEQQAQYAAKLASEVERIQAANERAGFKDSLLVGLGRLDSVTALERQMAGERQLLSAKIKSLENEIANTAEIAEQIAKQVELNALKQEYADTSTNALRAEEAIMQAIRGAGIETTAMLQQQMQDLERVRGMVGGDPYALRQIERAGAGLESRQAIGSGDAWQGAIAGLKDYYFEIENMSQMTHDNVLSVTGAMQSSISNVFYSMAAEGASWKEAMKGFFGDVAKSFSRAISDMIAQWLIAKALGMFGGAVAGGGIGAIFSTGASAAASSSLYALPALPARANQAEIPQAGKANEESIIIYNLVGEEGIARAMAGRSGKNVILNTINADIKTAGPTRKTIRRER